LAKTDEKSLNGNEYRNKDFEPPGWPQVSSCYLVLSLSCEFLKEGKATDEDMRSVASLGKAREIEI
jgi:hypothetical protein